jgi:hypothetical protein
MRLTIRGRAQAPVFRDGGKRAFDKFSKGTGGGLRYRLPRVLPDDDRPGVLSELGSKCPVGHEAYDRFGERSRIPRRHEDVLLPIGLITAGS